MKNKQNKEETKKQKKKGKSEIMLKEGREGGTNGRRKEERERK